ARGDVDAADRQLQAVAESADDAARAFLHARRGRALLAADRREAAREAFARAREAAHSDTARAALLEAEARALAVAHPPDSAASLRAAIELRRASPRSLALAGDLA